MIENGSTLIGTETRPTARPMEGIDQRPSGSAGSVRQRAEGPTACRGGGAAADDGVAA
jgi:hypothetical protein